MRTLYRVGIAAILIIGGWFVTELKASVIKLTLEQLTQRANIIVIGTVTDQESFWNSQHTLIYTNISLTVEETIKGPPSSDASCQVLGGDVGDVSLRSSNDPVFHVGERVILFLDNAYVPARIVGLFQGKITIVNNMVTWEGQKQSVADFLAAIRTASR